MKQLSYVLVFIGAAIFVWLSWKLVVTGYYPDEVSTLVVVGIIAFAFLGAGALIQQKLEKERKAALLQKFNQEEQS